ncbi:MAG: hypothetical protein LBG31_03100 [Prevotellaceae bacterium]|jgi:hypothetical protein|nr:hypothetical protein [Prevotellaceae bacterium]
MKTIFFFFAMAISIAAIATQPEPPVYYTGNDEPAAKAVYSWQSAVDSSQLAVGSENAADTLRPVCPTYFTGNNEPAASGLFQLEIKN